MTARVFGLDATRHPPALTPSYRSSVARSPRMPLVLHPATASELRGPVFGSDVIGPLDHDLVHNFGPGEALGPRTLVHGRVLDGDGRGVPNALVEIWQANAGGCYRHPRDGYGAPLDPGFGGCGRTLTDADGAYTFHTIRPGPYPWPNGGNDWRPMHIHFSLFGAAFAQRLITQMYFEGDPLIGLDGIVAGVPAGASAALVASLDMDRAVPMDALAYRFDIVLQGRIRTPVEAGGGWR